MITSTFGTIYTWNRTEAYTYTESDSNEVDLPLFESGGRDPTTVYHTSKIHAERGAHLVTVLIRRLTEFYSFEAVRKFVEEHKNEIGFDVTILNPPFVSSPNSCPFRPY